eukprot:4859430-Pyramimonas_sp.AAC.1
MRWSRRAAPSSFLAYLRTARAHAGEDSRAAWAARSRNAVRRAGVAARCQSDFARPWREPEP